MDFTQMIWILNENSVDTSIKERVYSREVCYAILDKNSGFFRPRGCKYRGIDGSKYGR
jgi:hypothetical protein